MPCALLSGTLTCSLTCVLLLSVRSAQLLAAQKELGSTEDRLAEKAGRLRASLQQEVVAAQQQVGGQTDCIAHATLPGCSAFLAASRACSSEGGWPALPAVLISV